MVSYFVEAGFHAKGYEKQGSNTVLEVLKIVNGIVEVIGSSPLSSILGKLESKEKERFLLVFLGLF